MRDISGQVMGRTFCIIMVASALLLVAHVLVYDIFGTEM
jgi:hypothetical protein